MIPWPCSCSRYTERDRPHPIARINNRTLCRVTKVHVIHEPTWKAAIIKTPFTRSTLDARKYYTSFNENTDVCFLSLRRPPSIANFGQEKVIPKFLDEFAKDLLNLTSIIFRIFSRKQFFAKTSFFKSRVAFQELI